MGTKNYSSYSDMITFSRASSGTALAKISYGAELVTVTTPDFLQNATASGLTVTSDGTIPCRSSFTLSNLTIGSIYLVTCEVTNTTSVFWDDAPTLAGSVQTIINESANNYIVASATTMYLGFKEFSPSLGQEFVFSNVSVRKILFDQPDGTLQLFNHPANQPRVEYDYQGNRLGLLVEQPRTNVVTYSTITNANWTKYATTITDNAVVAPDGTQTAAKIISTQSGKGTCYLPGTPTGAYVDSFYAKAGTSNFFFIESPSTAPGVYFDLANGTVATITAGQTATIQYVGNGWFRCSVYATRTHGNISCGFSDADNNPNQANGNYGYVWGAQAELGSFPTSYIPTAGSTVTRAADVASIGVGAFGYNVKAGTIVYEAHQAVLATGGLQSGAFDLTKSGHLERVYSFYDVSKHLFVRNAVSVSADLDAGDVSAGSAHKIGGGFKKDNFGAVIDGGTVVTDTLGDMPVAATNLFIGSLDAGQFPLNGHISSIAYYPRRLTDAQIKALTSPPETPTLSLTFDDSSTSYLETSIHG